MKTNRRMAQLVIALAIFSGTPLPTGITTTPETGTSLTTTNVAEAGRGGGGGGSRSGGGGGRSTGGFRVTRSSSPSNSGGSTRDAQRARQQAAQTQNSARNGSKATSPNTLKATAPKATFSTSKAALTKSPRDIQRAREQAKASKTTYQARQSQYAKPAQPVNTTNYSNNNLYRSTQTSRSTYTYTNVVSYQTNYYSGLGWSPSPWSYHYAPYYGAYSTSWLDYVLFHPANWGFYHHHHDASLSIYLSELRQDKENTKLQTQLDQLEREMERMKQSGTARDTNYVPPGFKSQEELARVAIAPEILAPIASTPILRLATGPTGGVYAQFGGMLNDALENVSVDSVTTNGSIENLQLLTKGEVDAVLVQADALRRFATDHASIANMTQHEVVTEYVFAFAGESLDDISKATTFYAGPEGSGTDVFVRNFAGTFKKSPTIINDHYDSTLRKVSSDPTTVAFVVTGLNSGLVKRVQEQYGNTVQLLDLPSETLVAMRDPLGHPMYSAYTMPVNTLAELQRECSWLAACDWEETQMISLNALLLINPEFGKLYGPKAEQELDAAITPVRTALGEQMKIQAGSVTSVYIARGAFGLVFVIGILFIIGRRASRRHLNNWRD